MTLLETELLELCKECLNVFTPLCECGVGIDCSICDMKQTLIRSIAHIERENSRIP